MNGVTWRNRGTADPSVSPAFSLIEVIVAVALFAGAVAVLLALLPGLALRNAEAADRLAAQHLPDALQVELRRLSATGFATLVTEVPVMGGPPESGFAFVAARDGRRLQSCDHPPAAADRIPGDQQYFLMECWRLPDEAPGFEATPASLALAVRVTWPHHQPGSASITPAESRHELLFAMGLNR